MDTPDEDTVYGNHGITMIGRLLAAAMAVIFCYLLYRFAQAYYFYRERPNTLRNRGSRRRIPIFGGGRKDVLYAAVPNGGFAYEDEEEDVYHDDQDDHDNPPRQSINLNRPLPEIPGTKKPLPPLPEPDLEPE